METLVLLAQVKEMEYVSFFWSKYFFDYLDCDETTVNLTPYELLRLSDQAAAQNIAVNLYSETGLAFGPLARGQ